MAIEPQEVAKPSWALLQLNAPRLSDCIRDAGRPQYVQARGDLSKGNKKIVMNATKASDMQGSSPLSRSQTPQRHPRQSSAQPGPSFGAHTCTQKTDRLLNHLPANQAHEPWQLHHRWTAGAQEAPLKTRPGASGTRGRRCQQPSFPEGWCLRQTEMIWMHVCEEAFRSTTLPCSADMVSPCLQSSKSSPRPKLSTAALASRTAKPNVDQRTISSLLQKVH